MRAACRLPAARGAKPRAARTLRTAIIFTARAPNLPPDTKNLKPIKSPHLSAVYRSTSTGHLKVAFSVPIENGKKGKEREVVGVLAMTVDLGEFNVLEKKLPKGHEVVLIDMRESTIDGARRGGD